MNHQEQQKEFHEEREVQPVDLMNDKNKKKIKNRYKRHEQKERTASRILKY